LYIYFENSTVLPVLVFSIRVSKLYSLLHRLTVTASLSGKNVVKVRATWPQLIVPYHGRRY